MDYGFRAELHLHAVGVINNFEMSFSSMSNRFRSMLFSVAVMTSKHYCECRLNVRVIRRISSGCESLIEKPGDRY